MERHLARLPMLIAVFGLYIAEQMLKRAREHADLDKAAKKAADKVSSATAQLAKAATDATLAALADTAQTESASAALSAANAIHDSPLHGEVPMAKFIERVLASPFFTDSDRATRHGLGHELVARMLFDEVPVALREIVVAICVCGGQVPVSMLHKTDPGWWQLSIEQQFCHEVVVSSQPHAFSNAELLAGVGDDDIVLQLTKTNLLAVEKVGSVDSHISIHGAWCIEILGFASAQCVPMILLPTRMLLECSNDKCIECIHGLREFLVSTRVPLEQTTDDACMLAWTTLRSGLLHEQQHGCTTSTAKRYRVQLGVIHQKIGKRPAHVEAGFQLAFGDALNLECQYEKALEALTAAQSMLKPLVTKKRNGAKGMLMATQHRMAAVLNCTAEHGRSLQVWQELLQDQSRMFGRNHLDTAKTRENIAIVYRQQGKHAGALELYTQVLAVKEKVRGLEHLVMAETKTKHWLFVLHPGQVRRCTSDV